MDEQRSVSSGVVLAVTLLPLAGVTFDELDGAVRSADSLLFDISAGER